MGIRDVIVRALGYRLGTPRTGSLISDMAQMQLPPGWGYQTYLQAYGQVGWLFACVSVIANSVARQPWHLYELDKQGEREEILQHPLIDLLNRMNPFQTRYQFFYLATMYKKLVGEEFWQMNFNGGGQPAEVWLAPPAHMSVIPSATKYIDHYEYRAPSMSQPIRFNVDEIIHIMSPNPYNPYRGLSEAQALTVDIDSERYAARYQQKAFFNDCTPGFMIEYPAQDLPTAEARKELVMELEERHKGFRNRGKPMILWGGKANTVTLSPREMDFANLRNYSRDAILGAYHVPRSVIGITENVNRANADAGNYTFAMYVIQPELAALREAMNKELCPFFGDNLYLDFDNPIPEDTTAGINNAVNLFKAGVITRNDALVMIDQEPLDTPEGDEYFTQPQGFGSGQTPLSPVDNQERNPSEAGKGIKKKIVFDEVAKEAYWKEYVSRAEAYERPLLRALQDNVFGPQKEEALAKFRENPSRETQLVDMAAHKKRYVDTVTPILTRAMDAAIKNGKHLLDPINPHKAEGSILPVVSTQALKWLKTRILWAANEIGDESAARLGKILYDGFNEGLSTDIIARRIELEFDDYFSQVRAERIARTETITASAQGAIEGYKESGAVNEVEFYTALDERTCDLCLSFHGQKFSFEDSENFITGSTHPSCRCVWLPVIES